MLTWERVIKRCGMNPCRGCINRKFKINLQPEDLRYESDNLYLCSCCGQHRHIVTGLRKSAKLKTLLK